MPLTVGQEWSGYAAQLQACIADLRHAREGLLELAVGGTAVGTGLNAPAGFSTDVAAELAKLTGTQYVTAPNKFAALGSLDPMVRAHAALRGTAENAGPGFTSGMRARNLGNIGYFGQHEPGLVGPSNSRDVDHSIAMYATQEDGIRAAARLALRKYQGGMRDTASLIAGPKGWTPGALGPGASVNIARAMGLTNRDDLHLDQPDMMHKFLRGLATQEHGKAGSYYTDKMIDDALAGRGATTATGGVPGKTAGVSPVLTDMVKRASEILGTQLSVYSGKRSPEHNAAVGGAQNSLHMRGWATDLEAAGHPKGDHAFWEQANSAMAQAAHEMHQPYRWVGRSPVAMRVTTTIST